MPQDTTHGQRPQGLDRLFAESRPRAEDFEFGRDTAAVFDDMLDRSVPFYAEIQRMIGELAADFAVSGHEDLRPWLLDGEYVSARSATVWPRISMSSSSASTRPRTCSAGRSRSWPARVPMAVRTQHQDLNERPSIDNASVVLMVLTLQFVRPLNREIAAGRVAPGLERQWLPAPRREGARRAPTFNRLFIDHYYEMKRRKGYSDLEIAQKREALENVLVPYRLEENRRLLRRAGFRQVDVFFKWYNFCGIIATR